MLIDVAPSILETRFMVVLILGISCYFFVNVRLSYGENRTKLECFNNTHYFYVLSNALA